MDWQSQFTMFMPHGMCLLWRPELMSLHIISDLLIALAYFTIPFSILRFVRGRDDLDRSHLGLAFLFASFIGLCGLTHVVSVVVLWVPIYVIEGWLKAATAIVSVITAGGLIALVPHALKLPSTNSMQQEISARRETEKVLRGVEHDLRQSILLLSTVIEVVPGLLYAKDQFGRMLLSNKAVLDLIGKPWAEVEGKRDIEFLPDPRQAEIVMANDRRIMDSRNTEELEEIVDHPTMGTRVYLSHKVPFSSVDDEFSGLVGLSVDITGRKTSDKEVLRVARRTAMGDMAAAIAHEINQPLASISMYIAGSIALLKNDAKPETLIETLTLAKDQCMHTGEIIRRVRSFVSDGDDDRKLENISVLVDEACSLALLGSGETGITTSVRHDDAYIPVLVDAVQIEQVIVNLVRNAIDAMSGAPGMTLNVTTGYGTDGMAMVSVSDNGPGISTEVANRLFEAFVSTKGTKGMGLGLSICRTVIEAHGGKIWVEQSAEQGTTFRFTLPLTDCALAA